MSMVRLFRVKLYGVVADDLFDVFKGVEDIVDRCLGELLTELIDGHQNALGEIFKLLYGKALGRLVGQKPVQIDSVVAKKLFFDLLKPSSPSSFDPFPIGDRDYLRHTINVAPYSGEDKG